MTPIAPARPSAWPRPKSQLDTLKSETIVQSRASDALAAQISEAIAGRREIELSQDEFRQKLISFCNNVQPAVKKLPPLIMAPTLSGLSLLISDLTHQISRYR